MTSTSPSTDPSGSPHAGSGSTSRTDAPPSGGGVGLAFVALLAASALLVVAARSLPESICDAWLGPAVIAFGGAQALAVVALGALRRARVPGLASVVLALAWAMVAGAVLVLRQTAGDFGALQREEIVFGLVGTLGLFAMFHGMALRLEKAGAMGWVVMPALAFVLALGYDRVNAESLPRRMYASWDDVTRLDDAVVAFAAKNGKPPVGGAGLDALVAQLEPTFGKDLPRKDGWGRSLDYMSDGKSWEVASRGAFGERGPKSAGAVRAYADDLVIRDGTFTSWPESPCVDADAGDATSGTQATGPSGPPEPPPELPVPPGAIDTRHKHRR